jgi:rod shape-determining protein MreB
MKEFKNNIAFDLGASNCRIYKGGKQILNFRSEVIINGRTISQIFQNGKIANFQATEFLLQKRIKEIQKPILGFLYPSFTALISVPSEKNEVSLRAFRDALRFVGAKTVYMLSDCFIAASGLGINIPKSTYMIVDSGAGKTSITTATGYKIIKNDMLDICGNSFNEAIKTHISIKHGITVKNETIESIKKRHANMTSSRADNKTIQISGTKKHTDIRKDIKINCIEISECLQLDVELLSNRINRHYENLEEENKKEINKTGIYLIGNGFKLKGLINLIQTKLPVAPKSYKTNEYFLGKGIEKIQNNPEELFDYLIV